MRARVVWPTFSITSTTAYTNARILFKKAVAASCLLFWKRFVILFTFRPKKKGKKIKKERKEEKRRQKNSNHFRFFFFFFQV